MTHLSSKLEDMMVSEYGPDPEKFYDKWTSAGGTTTAAYKRYVCAECRRIRDRDRTAGHVTHQIKTRKASTGLNPQWLEDDTTIHICNPISFATIMGRIGHLIGFNVPLNLTELAELEEEEQFANQADQNPVNDIPNPMQGMEESDNDE